MQMLDRIRYRNDPSSERQGPAEYWELISTEMNLLYVLSFLLTAHKEKAERCLEKTLDEFIEGAGDFIEWVRTRGRNAVLEHAFSIMKPGPDATEGKMDLSDRLFRSAGDHLFGAIAALPAFERFVFAITTIYGKSDIECARLLRTPRWKVAIARELSEQILATNIAEGAPSNSTPSARCDGAYFFNPRCSSC